MKRSLLKGALITGLALVTSVAAAKEIPGSNGLTYSSNMNGMNLSSNKKGLSMSSLLRTKGSGSTGAKGVIKMNLSSLVFKNFAFQAEYSFHKNMSGALGVSYILPYKIPASLYEGEGGVTNGKLFGYAITPEFRFYPGKKVDHQAPHGFYIAPYGRFAKFIAQANYSDSTGIDGTVEASYSGFGGGLMIGSQWIIGKHFSIDFFIIGAHYGAGKIALTAYDPKFSTISEGDKQEIQNDFDETFSVVTDDVKLTFSGDYMKASIKAPFGGIRGLGLNIGFAF